MTTNYLEELLKQSAIKRLLENERVVLDGDDKFTFYIDAIDSVKHVAEAAEDVVHIVSCLTGSDGDHTYIETRSGVRQLLLKKGIFTKYSLISNNSSSTFALLKWVVTPKSKRIVSKII